jgi:cell division protein FtsB
MKQNGTTLREKIADLLKVIESLERENEELKAEISNLKNKYWLKLHRIEDK